MNEKIMKQAGFTKEMERVALGKCATCSADINVGDFNDALSEKEFKISGMCQECQDEVFS